MMDTKRYLQFVQSVAKQINKVFYLEHGQGKDFVNPVNGWYIEDLSGWLVSPEIESEFLARCEEYPDEFEPFYVLAIWTRDGYGDIGVEFHSVEDYAKVRQSFLERGQ